MSGRSLLGLSFPALGMEDIVRLIDARPAGAPFGYVVTPNADHFVRLADDPALAAIYQDALLRVLDSRVVARTARLLGLRSPPVVTGSDVTAMLIARLDRGERVTIVGMPPDRLARLCAVQGLAPPAHHNPPIGFDTEPASWEAAIQFVLDHPARLIFLAVGSPRQERLAAAIAARPGATGTALCIGASLDFLAGGVPRAPRWMRAAGLEWLHRLAREPRRLARRYLLDDWRIFALLARERFLKQ